MWKGLCLSATKNFTLAVFVETAFGKKRNELYWLNIFAPPVFLIWAIFIFFFYSEIFLIFSYSKLFQFFFYIFPDFPLISFLLLLLVTIIIYYIYDGDDDDNDNTDDF